MSKGTNQHVTPHKGGGWQVKGAGSKKATRITSTKQAAVKIARKMNMTVSFFWQSISAKVLSIKIS